MKTVKTPQNGPNEFKRGDLIYLVLFLLPLLKLGDCKAVKAELISFLRNK